MSSPLSAVPDPPGDDDLMRDEDLEQARSGWSRDDWQEPYMLVTGVDPAPHGTPGHTGLVTLGIVPPGAIRDDAPILRVEHVHRFPYGTRAAQIRDYLLQLLDDTSSIVVPDKTWRCPNRRKHAFVVGSHGLGRAGRDELYSALMDAGAHLERMTIPSVTAGSQPPMHRSVPYADLIDLINGVLDQWDLAVPSEEGGDELLLSEALRESRARPESRMPAASAKDESWWRQETHSDLLLALGEALWGMDRLCSYSWFGYSIRSLTGAGRWQWEHAEYRRLQLIHDCGGRGNVLCCWNCVTCRPKMLRAPRQFQRLYDRCDACKRRIEEGMKPPPRRRITRRNTFELLEQRSLGDRIQFGEPIKVFGRLWRYTPREGWTPAE